jgi:hypothetical protein
MRGEGEDGEEEEEVGGGGGGGVNYASYNATPLPDKHLYLQNSFRTSQKHEDTLYTRALL